MVISAHKFSDLGVSLYPGVGGSPFFVCIGSRKPLGFSDKKALVLEFGLHRQTAGISLPFYSK